jgi:hypothetical protein
MTASETPANKKSFFSKFPRWTYWFAALLIVELIIILSVVFGYILPKKQKFQNNVSDCGNQYTREIENCGSSYRLVVSRCIKDCYANDLQCANDCYAKNGKYPTECAIGMLKTYENCVSNKDYYWPQ